MKAAARTLLLLRRSPQVLRQTIPAMAVRSGAVCFQRYLSAVAAPQRHEELCFRAEANVDFVRNAIRRLMVKDGAEVRPISDYELKHNLAAFANLFDEARACINDCKEARAGSLEYYEEAYTAMRAVDQVFNSYIDLLDDFRRASDEQLKVLCQDRLALAHRLKTLRQELHHLTHPKQSAA